jgi:hypothetical protein
VRGNHTWEINIEAGKGRGGRKERREKRRKGKRKREFFLHQNCP